MTEFLPVTGVSGTSTFELTLNQSEQFALFAFSGGVTRQLLEDAFEKFLDHPAFSYNMNACWDFCEAYPEIEISEIQTFSQFINQHLPKRGINYKLAFVANDTLNFALLDVYKLLMSCTQIEVEIFASQKKAYTWLSGNERSNQF